MEDGVRTKAVIFVVGFFVSFGVVLAISVLSPFSAPLVTLQPSEAEIRFQKEAQVLALIQRELRNPDSAQLRDIVFGEKGVVCGQVNAKDSSGGYVGFRHFMVNLETSETQIAPSMAALAEGGPPRANSTEEARRDYEALKAFSEHCLRLVQNF